MSINARLFYGLKCDICGREDEDWYDTPEECRQDCEHVDWLHLDAKRTTWLVDVMQKGLWVERSKAPSDVKEQQETINQ